MRVDEQSAGWDLGSGILDLGYGIWDLGSGILDLGSEVFRDIIAGVVYCSPSVRVGGMCGLDVLYRAAYTCFCHSHNFLIVLS